MKHKLLYSMTLVLFAAGMMFGSNSDGSPASALDNDIREAILSSPRYGIFDMVGYERNGDNVTLSGYVVMPVTSVEIVGSIKKIESISNVNNRIEVLPVSFNDSNIRWNIYNTLFRTADLYRYMLGSFPSIRIIVKNSSVMLEGFVDNKLDKSMAFLIVRGLPGILSIQNNLIISE
ncbi:MAG: BON domain-containing protein [Candidatus Aminicenantes bacterium]|nr:BON domain-containing protein [Candidatus Aminicenantes bacterium]